MAYVEKHGTTWRYRIPCGIDPAAGKRKQVTKSGFRTKKEAALVTGGFANNTISGVHTHISLLAEAGVPLHEIMDRVGQLDDETTKRVYLHVTKTRKKEACALFDRLMQGTKKA